jgi:alkylation response protein AidB-like acyl-CoA dehydrogenase
MTTQPSPVVSELLSRVAQLAPAIAAQRAALDIDRRLPEPLFEALADAGLMRLWLPRALGGPQLSLHEFVSVIEEVSRLEGAVGWAVSLGATYSRLAGYLSEDVAREIFSAPRACLAGTITPSGRAFAVPGGYRVQGRWSYGSGIHHASTVIGNCVVVGDDGKPPAGEPPAFRTCFFRPSDVTVHDNWHVSGLRGTGSCDYEVRDVFVPDAYAIDAFAPAPVQPGVLYVLPFISVFAMSVAVVPLGIARRAISALLALAKDKVPAGGSAPLCERETIQRDIGRAEALLRSARALLFEALDAMWREGEAGAPSTLQTRALARIAYSLIGENAPRVVDMMCRAGGGTSIYESSPLERCFRDVHAAVKHIALVENNFTLAGRVFLGMDPGTPRF